MIKTLKDLKTLKNLKTFASVVTLASLATFSTTFADVPKAPKAPMKPEILYSNTENFMTSWEHNKDVKCLADAVYFEALHDDEHVAAASVAWVATNRMLDSRYPDKICDVLHQNKMPGTALCQFSYYCDGKPEKANYNSKHWKRSWVIAYIILKNHRVLVDPTEGSTLYHADYVNPRWNKSENIQLQTIYGKHLFYKEHRNKIVDIPPKCPDIVCDYDEYFNIHEYYHTIVNSISDNFEF